MDGVKCSETCVCREMVTKERLYERLNNSIRQSEVIIAKEVAKLDTLRETKRNLDEYFEDSECRNVKPEKTGHWIDTGEGVWIAGGRNLPIVKCSVCNKDSLEKGFYCHNCGAKMESEVEKCQKK